MCDVDSLGLVWFGLVCVVVVSESDLVCPDSRIERLQLTMTEVLKRQSSKSKKNYNQVNGGFTC